MATKRVSKCKAIDIEKTLRGILGDYQFVTQSALEKAIDETGEAVAEAVKNAAPERTGEYKKSIFFGFRSYGKKGQSKAYVYSEAPHYRLTHLLEFGHASRSGGRVEPSPLTGHWEQGQRLAEKELEKNFKKALEK